MKGKEVPVNAMKAYGGSGGIAPLTHTYGYVFRLTQLLSIIVSNTVSMFYTEK